ATLPSPHQPAPPLLLARADGRRLAARLPRDPVSGLDVAVLRGLDRRAGGRGDLPAVRPRPRAVVLRGDRLLLPRLRVDAPVRAHARGQPARSATDGRTRPPPPRHPPRSRQDAPRELQF